MKKVLIALSILFLSPVLGIGDAKAQNLDSLYLVWQDPAQPDSSRVTAYKDYIWNGYLFSKPDTAEVLAETLHTYANKHSYPEASGMGYNLQGIANQVQGNYPRALEYYQKSLAIREETENKSGIAGSLNNIGNVYSDQGNNPRAIKYYQKSLAIREELGDKKGIAGILNNIGIIYFEQGDYPRALEYYQKNLTIYEEIRLTDRQIGDKSVIAGILNGIGTIYSEQGNYPLALEYYQKSLAIKEEIGDKIGIASSLGNIGIIYDDQGNYPRALEYYQKSLSINEEIGDKKAIAAKLNNIGSIYSEQDDRPRALEHFQKSLAIREEIGDKTGIATSLSNIGNFYYRQGNYPSALEYFQKGLVIREEIRDKNGTASSLNNIGSIYQKQGKHSLALDYCQKGLALAEEIGALNWQEVAFQCLYDTHKALGKYKGALRFFEQMTTVRDSLFNEENTKKLTRLEMQYKFDKKEAETKAEQEKKDAIALQELKRQKLVRNGFMGGFAVVLLFAGVFFTQRNRIGKEKKRSEELLLNILPAEVAEELKAKGETQAQMIDQVTVLFTDFKGFTALSEKVTPKELISDLHACFSEFDGICEKYGIEKIKTIGDAYMAAGGLPSPNDTHPQDVAHAALEMAQVVERGKAKKIEEGLPFFEIRIGIHTGPVVAGIVGVKKFQYDIWGDTVNTASRMESSGAVGKVNVSEFTYELIKDDFTCEYRGELEAKGKGKLRMYFINGV